MPILKTDKTKIFYTDSGSGNPLLFIHGLGASSSMFAPQVAAFQSTHRIICPDLRGNGLSGRLAGPVDTILDRQCDDIAALLASLQITTAVICGVSYGGVVACHFALRYPEKTRAIILVDSAGDTEPASIKERLIRISLCSAFWIIYLPAAPLIWLIRHYYRRWPLARRTLIQVAQNLRRHEMSLQHFALLRTNHTRRLHQLTCPALGIVGNTLDISQRLMQRTMEQIAGSELYVITDAMDPSNLCQEKNFAKILIAFLRKINWQ